MLTLAVDCGGSFIKSALLDNDGTLHGQEQRRATPYPLSPERLIEELAGIAAAHNRADRITVGLPGMIRHGVVINTPHYVNEAGPFTRRDPDLFGAWRSFDMQTALGDRLNLPTLVWNDADLHGAGVISGVGLEVVFTLGTGLGSALFDGGQLAPHLELSHASVRSGVWYDHWLGEAERRRVGTPLWNRRVRQLVERWRPVFLWDRVYIGGGNSRLLTEATRRKLGDDVTVVSNSAALYGGVRVWQLHAQ